MLALPRGRQIFWASVIAALTIAVFLEVTTHFFLGWDDRDFVYENPAVMSGLAPSSIGWALTSMSAGWYPLTWLSHMLDVEIWGLNAGGHLATNLLIHVVNALLLFWVLVRLTASVDRSAFVALLFAIHPMHVESVAWVSERRDTLSTFFALLALLFYARNRWRWRIAAVAAAMACSLMAKQMYVTLPVLLLLLDVWPLGRFRSLRDAKPLVVEKIPLFLLAAGGALVAIVGQKSLGAVQSITTVPLGDRLGNAALGYVRYLGKLLWPTKLAAFYPLVPPNALEVIGALSLLIAISAGVFLLRRRAPYLLVGWLSYLVVLLPVIGIVQIGGQAIADRYTYFAYVGLFVAIVWGVAELVPVARLSKAALATAGALTIAILAFLAWRQVRFWMDTETLFTRTIAVTPPNAVAECTLGAAFQMTEPDRALRHLRRCVSLLNAEIAKDPALITPWHAQPHIAIATALFMKTRTVAQIPERINVLDQVIREYQKALSIDPTAENAKRNLMLATMMKGKLEARGGPTTSDVSSQVIALLNSGSALSQSGRDQEALAAFQKAVELAPASPQTRIYLALILVRLNRNAESIEQLREAERIDPAGANEHLSVALRLAPSASNLRDFIARMESSR